MKWNITPLKRASKFSLRKRKCTKTKVEGEYCWVPTYAGGWEWGMGVGKGGKSAADQIPVF